MSRLYNRDCDVENLSPLALAFIGDCVFDLLVREKLLCQANRPVGVLHCELVSEVRCESQTKKMKKILPILSDKELSVYKRGRNAHTTRTPKSATKLQYHIATGFECLIGYLYLKNDIKRLREIFDIINK